MNRLKEVYRDRLYDYKWIIRQRFFAKRGEQLYWACRSGDKVHANKILDKALQNGESLYFVDQYRNTVFMTACENRMEEIAIQLAKTKNAYGYVQNRWGSTGLTIACQYKMEQAALALLQTGDGYIQAVTECGNTALEEAQRNGLALVISEILRLDKSCTNCSMFNCSC